MVLGNCMHGADLNPVEVITENQKKLEARYGEQFTVNKVRLELTMISN